MTSPGLREANGWRPADAPSAWPLVLGPALGIDQRQVLEHVAPLAPGSLLQGGQRLVAAGDAGLQADHRPVGLVLGEGQVQEVVGFVGGVPADQVGGHVEGGAERGGEHERSAGRQGGDLAEGHERRPQHDGVTDLVDAAPAGPPGELGELAGSEELVALAGPLRELVDHHRPGRHVDAERQRLGGEDRLHESGGEALLDRLLERRHHAGVVGGNAGFERREPTVVAEHREVLVGQPLHAAFGDGADLLAVLGGRQAHPRLGAALHRVLARRAAEDEVDGGQQATAVELIDDVEPSRRRVALAGAVARAGRAAGGALVEELAARVGTAVDQGRDQVEPLARAVVDREEVDQLDGSPVLEDRRRRAPDGRQPIGQLVGVGHRGREAHQLHVERRVDDDLLPHGTPVGVLEVVHLVEHHEPQPVERPRARVDHVAQDLGGHHHHRGVAVDGVVAGQQTDAVRPWRRRRSRTSGSRAP